MYQEADVPREKLVVGVPFYGRGFMSVPDVNNGLYQPYKGTMTTDYHTIKAEYLRKGQRFWHAEAEAPWLYLPGDSVMITYDDPESIGRKTDYVREQGLGGIMLWELSSDDPKASLLTAISSRIGLQ
jgi:chitinase